MHLPFIMVLTITWSSIAHSDSPLGYKEISAFRKVDTTVYKVKCSGSETVVDNMPSFKSIGSWGLCAAESSRACVQWYACQTKKLDCKSLSRDQEISRLSLQAWSRATDPDSNLSGNENMHRNLSLLSYKDGKPVQTGTSGALALFNSRNEATYFPESCYPFDQISNTKGKFDSDETVVNSLVSAENFYKKNRGKTEGFCEDCFASEIGQSFGISFDSTRLKTALKRKTFKEFMFELVFYNCDDRIRVPTPEFGLFPDPDDPNLVQNSVTGETIGQKVIETISTLKAPINLDRICIFRNSTTKECELHSIALTGVDRVCKTEEDCSTKKPANCRDRVKVHNSWGADWQNRVTDNNYVDLASLMEQVEKPSKTGALSWFNLRNQKKKK